MKKNYLEPKINIEKFEREEILTNSVVETAEDVATTSLQQKYQGQSIGIQSVEWTF